MLRATFLALLALAVAACSDGDPAAGGERAACRADGSCDVGLECWSEVCVRPPSADCGAVAARLAPIRLGNYATEADRRPLIAELRAQCQREQLTAREGRCLVTALDEDALADCPRALLPELDGVRRRCTPLGPRVLAMSELLGAEAAQEASAIVVDLCVDDAWPKAVTSCAMTASSLDDARACATALPRSARRALERKLERVAMRASHTRVAPPDPWAAGTGTLPPSCQRYMAVIEAYARCPQVPASARDSLRQAVDQMKTAWANFPPSSRATLDSACEQGVSAMQQAMTAMSCPTP